MSLAIQLANLATRMATEAKSIRASIGPLASLATTEKSSIVLAINELRAGLEAGGTIVVAAITDASTIGKNILKASDGPAVRGLIGAGTSSLAVGPGATDAKAGNYQPTWAQVSAKPAVIASGADVTEARAAIGAGTSNLAVGTGSADAKAGDYQPTWGQVSGKPAFIGAGVDAAAARSAIGAGTSSLAIGTAVTDAKAGNYQPTWAQVTGKPVVIASGVDQASARATIGAQSAADVDGRVSAIIGTATSAMDTLGEIETILNGNVGSIGTIVTSLGKRVAVDSSQAFTEPEKLQGRSNLDVYSKTEIGNPETNLVTIFEAALV